MVITDLLEYIDYYNDCNKSDLITVYKNLVGYADDSWNFDFLKSRIFKELEKESSLNKFITDYIPNTEYYPDFEYDFFRYIIGLSVKNETRLVLVLKDWGLCYKGKMPDNVYNYILSKYHNTLTVVIYEHIRQLNEYSLIIKLFYLISLINSKMCISLDAIESNFESNYIDLYGINEILYLFTRVYKILSAKTFEFIIPGSVYDWVKDYGELNLIMDLYAYILERHDIKYSEILGFMNIFTENHNRWIFSDFLEDKYSKKVIKELCNLQIIDKTTFCNKKVYRISDIGYVILNKKLPDTWLDNSNAINNSNLMYIPHNDNPLLIFKYMMNYSFVNPGNFLMIFNKYTSNDVPVNIEIVDNKIIARPS